MGPPDMSFLGHRQKTLLLTAKAISRCMSVAVSQTAFPTDGTPQGLGGPVHTVCHVTWEELGV